MPTSTGFKRTPYATFPAKHGRYRRRREAAALAGALPHRRTALGTPAQFWSDQCAADTAIPPRAHEGKTAPPNTRRPPRADLDSPAPVPRQINPRPSSCCSKSTRWSRSPRPRSKQLAAKLRVHLGRCRRGSRTGGRASGGWAARSCGRRATRPASAATAAAASAPAALAPPGRGRGRRRARHVAAPRRRDARAHRLDGLAPPGRVEPRPAAAALLLRRPPRRRAASSLAAQLRAAAAMQGAGGGSAAIRRRRRARRPRWRPRGAAEGRRTPGIGVAPRRAGPRRRRRRRPRPRRDCGDAGGGGRRRPRLGGVDAPRRRAQRRAVGLIRPFRRGVGHEPRRGLCQACGGTRGRGSTRGGPEANPNPGTLPGPLLRLLVSAKVRGAALIPPSAPPLAPSPLASPPPPCSRRSRCSRRLNPARRHLVHARGGPPPQTFLRGAARAAARRPRCARMPRPPPGRQRPRPSPSLTPPSPSPYREDRVAAAMAGAPPASRSTSARAPARRSPSGSTSSRSPTRPGSCAASTSSRPSSCRSTTSRSARRRVSRRLRRRGDGRRGSTATPRRPPRRRGGRRRQQVSPQHSAGAPGGGEGRACSPTRTRCSRPFWTFERAPVTAGQLCGRAFRPSSSTTTPSRDENETKGPGGRTPDCFLCRESLNLVPCGEVETL